MSCEESYLAILRYLTDEGEPYAPGTPGNTKRKIRKAAACYVVRDGVLFYQRRRKGQDAFSELEVVLQDPRRKELISRAHVLEGGEHLNQQLTWETISQKYWWRGIQKQLKDHIRECENCARRRATDEGSGRGMSIFGRLTKRKVADDEDLEEEEELDDGLFFMDRSKVSDNEELVYVNSTGEVNQFLSQHGQTMLDKLNQQRLGNKFCDITLLIEGEEYRAHKAVMAACSEYFNELFFEKGAATTHEAVVDLAGFTKDSFLPLLDFAYTSTLTFNFSIMAEIANLARHLLMSEVLQICESVHKQVEGRQLMLYQRRHVHTVVPDHVASPQDAADGGGAYTVTIQSDGSAVVTHTGLAVAGEPFTIVAPGGTEQQVAVDAQAVEGTTVLQGEDGQTLTLIAHAGQAALISHGGEGEEGETMTVVTHSGQAGVGKSFCLAIEQPQAAEAEAETFVLNVEADPAEPSEVTPPEAPTPAVAEGTATETLAPDQLDPPPQKRKRGRPAKVKKEVEVEVEVLAPPVEQEEEGGLSTDEDKQGDMSDPSKRRLRQRSMAEGGYARLHMGLEGEEEGKRVATPPHTTTPKVVQRPGKRGRPPKQPVENSAAEEKESAGEVDVPVNVSSEHVDSDEAATKSADPEAATEEGDKAPADGATEGDYTCMECGMSFPRRYALIMHAMKHDKARGYKCSLCNKEFQYVASLRAHLTRHKQRSSQRAPAASKVSDEERGNKTTAAPPQTTRKYVCDLCGKTLPRLYSLSVHMLQHTGVRPHACKVCGKTFAHKYNLKMHRVLHDVTKQFQCQHCDKSFVSKRNMEEHTSLHTGESKYLCNKCGATFYRASALSKHLKKHKPKPDVRAFACSRCDKRFFEAKDLQQHMNKHLVLKPFQCDVCGKCYSWKKDWYSHVKSHSVVEPYKCNVCGKEFLEKALFRRHVKKATHGKKGRVKQNLERHCEHCGRKFVQLREYRRHMNTHQGIKPFECVTCGVAWADARSLKRHVRTHTGERPYVCPVCQEGHIDARTLRRHMTKHHVDSLPGKIMLEKDTLQFHNQGTQVEHAVSILPADLPPELRLAQPPPSEEIETVLITEETVEAMDAVEAVQVADGAVLSDQGIMQVVNYVLAQHAITGVKVEEAPEAVQTMEVE
ncbi:zinc finger and BTB domain-containing protein 11 [Nerophis lumbriciformis]|uniref:zinc finger and BTB domain-containing protein 11 n=1 Tax=Nerophis lumbriciformis TaxID=546530 RepID=UPI003BA9054A